METAEPARVALRRVRWSGAVHVRPRRARAVGAAEAGSERAAVEMSLRKSWERHAHAAAAKAESKGSSADAPPAGERSSLLPHGQSTSEAAPAPTTANVAKRALLYAASSVSSEGAPASCGPKAETAVTPSSTRPMQPTSGRLRLSGGDVSSPLDARRSENTMVSPANGATTESGSTPSTATSTTVANTPNSKKPNSHLGLRQAGKSARSSVALFIRSKPAAEQLQPTGMSSMAAVRLSTIRATSSPEGVPGGIGDETNCCKELPAFSYATRVHASHGVQHGLSVSTMPYRQLLTNGHDWGPRRTHLSDTPPCAARRASITPNAQ
jgi:hypothetical protein